MNTNKDVNFEELARCTDDFNGAQCKAVCIEAVRIYILSIRTNQNLIFLGYDCITSKWGWSSTWRFYGCYSWSSSKKENEFELLCLI